MAVLEYDGKILIIDCGVLFPDDDQPGVDLILPDFSYIEDRLDDIEAIVLTHGHIDHYGAAARLLRRSGRSIEVAGHESDRLSVEKGLEAPRRAFISFYRLMGAPFAFQLSLLLLKAIIGSLGRSCRISRFLEDGDSVMMGRYKARVIHTPGHTRGSICLFLEEEKALFSGDHILGHITPNAFVMLDFKQALPVRMSQVEFYESLEKVMALSPQIVFPAHGKVLKNPGDTVAMFKREFANRQDGIRDILRGSHLTAYQVARRLFPDIRGYRLPLEIFLALSEVYTHLQVLQKEGEVTHADKGRVLIYSLA
jgi:glyoxylase-like metal-dependent hydrolase (beta-lactamase superfamily II)